MTSVTAPAERQAQRPGAGRLSLPPSAPARPCAVVTSGTSRFVVLSSTGLAGEEDRCRLVWDVLGGHGSVGLGDEHYQANKVVLVDDPTGSSENLRFRFYQLNRDTGQVYSTLECSNATPVAAVWARLHLDSPDALDRASGPVRVQNLNTGQPVLAEPPVASAWWRGDWGVTFTGLTRLQAALTRDAEAFTVELDGAVAGGHVVRHGNVFVLAELSPSELTPALVARLAAVGDDVRRRSGLEPSVTKVLGYQPREGAGPVLSAEAVCYSSGQQHHSLPGSAAMALGAFLTARGLVPVVGRHDGAGAAAAVRLEHPSGAMTVRTDLRSAADPASVVATSFSTPVRLLLCGSVVV